jgi:hypothetical protein
MSVARPTKDSSLDDMFPFGIVRPVTPKGKQRKRPQDDRSIVLMMGALLDQALEAAILAKLPGIKPDNEAYIFLDDGAPLRDLDAKIRLAFGLQIVGEAARSDLSLIRHIRNAFAHTRLPISFATPEVAAACTHLDLPIRAPGLIEPNRHPREVFIWVGAAYASILLPDTPNHYPDSIRLVLDLPSLQRSGFSPKLSTEHTENSGRP